MKGMIFMKYHREYPGYKLKKGTLCSGTTITEAMLNGRIPLTVNVNYAQPSGGGGVINVYLATNIGSIKFATYSYNGTIVQVNDIKMDLETMFGDKFYDIKSIAINPSAATGASKSISVVKWLEKSGGGVLNPLIKNGITFLRKVVSNVIGSIIKSGKNPFFPAGYKYVTVGTFPGLSDKVIPVLVSWSCSCSGTNANWSNGGAYCYYDKGAKYFKIGSVSARASATQAYGYGNADGIAFLPHYFNYNWDQMKSITNAGGTVISWLEKVIN